MAQLLVRGTARHGLVLLWKELPAGPPSVSAMAHIRSPMRQRSADPSGTDTAYPGPVFVVPFSSPKSHTKPESIYCPT